jgi:hypothetical protein
MTESSFSTPTKKLDFARIIPALYRPQQAFVDINAKINVSWLTPLLVLSISSALVVFVSGYLTSRAAMMGEVQLPRDWEWWTPDMQANYMQAQQSMQGPVFAYVIPLVSALVGLWLGWLILSGLLHLGSTLLGGRGSMQSALNITGWASLPFLIRDILRIVFMLIVGHSITSPGLSGFAGSAAFVAQMLARVDIFFIWSIVLLVIGFGVGDSLPKLKAITNVVIVTLLLLLLQSGIGTLLSNASGLVVQRPFF